MQVVVLLGKMSLTFLLVGVLAGCVEHSPSDQADTPTHPGVAEGIDDLVLNGTAAAWTDCTGFYTAKRFPPGENPAEAPPGWEPDGLHATTSVALSGFTCERLSFHDFEGGPIHFLVEAHNGASPPEDCLSRGSEGSGSYATWVVHRLWLSDAEVAGLLTSELDVPTGVLDAQQMAASLTVDGERWEWQVESLSSFLEIVDSASETESPALGMRLLWHNGTGAGALQIDLDVSSPSPAPTAAAGEFHEPFLLAGQSYMDAGSIQRGDLDWNILVFGDVSCEEYA